MALLDNSYGDPAEIGKLTPLWAKASGSTFDTTTAPTLASVESWCDQVSGLINTILSEYGFTVPVANTDAKLMLDMFVNEEVASIVEGTHGSGRYGPTALSKRAGGTNRFQIVHANVSQFVAEHAAGLERLGVTRTFDQGDSIGYRGQDTSGDLVEPMFKREDFGETYSTVDT